MEYRIYVWNIFISGRAGAGESIIFIDSHLGVGGVGSFGGVLWLGGRYISGTRSPPLAWGSVVWNRSAVSSSLEVGGSLGVLVRRLWPGGR